MPTRRPTSRPWTPADVAALRAGVAAGGAYPAIAKILRRSLMAVKCKAQKLRLVTCRQYTPGEIDYVRTHHGTLPVTEIARRMKRPVGGVYRVSVMLGLSRKQLTFGEPFEKLLRARHAEGWSDAEIAAEWGCERHTVGDWRKRLGLKDNTLSLRRRRRVAERTKQQLAEAGLPSIGHLRVEAFKRFARENGWPEDLRPRAVQILNALWDRGPMTRRQIADAIGMPWKGSRKSLVSNDPEGSYLAHLIKRGLVVSLGRIAKVTGQGRGKSCQVYSLPLTIERKVAS